MEDQRRDAEVAASGIHMDAMIRLVCHDNMAI